MPPTKSIGFRRPSFLNRHAVKVARLRPVAPAFDAARHRTRSGYCQPPQPPPRHRHGVPRGNPQRVPPAQLFAPPFSHLKTLWLWRWSTMLLCRPPVPSIGDPSHLVAKTRDMLASRPYCRCIDSNTELGARSWSRPTCDCEVACCNIIHPSAKYSARGKATDRRL